VKTVPPGWQPLADPDALIPEALNNPEALIDPEALIKEARRRQRRRRVVIALATVLLAGAAGIAVGLTRPGGHSSGDRGPRRPSAVRTPSSGAFALAALPAFFADAVIAAEGDESLEVRASASGAVVAQDENMPGVSALAATGTDSFVIALPVGNECATRLYRVQLSAQGRPGGLSPVGPELHGLVSSLAASAGGSVIGYALSGCANGDPEYIGVFDTRTQRSRQWGDVDVTQGEALSMSRNGDLLAFTGWNVPGSRSDTSQFVRVLATDAPAGTVAERSRVVLRTASQSDLGTVSLSPSGTSFYLCTQAGYVTRVAEYRTSTGELQHDLARLGGDPAQPSCSMGLDTSGQFLLVPYSVVPANRPMAHPTLTLAEIDIATRAVRTLTIQLPADAGMDPSTGMMAAW
jgi:hypothetical protein